MMFSPKVLFATSSALTMLAGMASALSGDATYYATGLGACGFNSNDNQHVVALSVGQYGSGGKCKKNIKVQYQGKSVTATVVDKCPGCAGNSIDLSPSAFKELAPLSKGRIQVNWNYV